MPSKSSSVGRPPRTRYCFGGTFSTNRVPEPYATRAFSPQFEFTPYAEGIPGIAYNSSRMVQDRVGRPGWQQAA